MYLKFTLTIICVLLIPVINGQNCKTEKRCRVSRIHGMKSADCYQKDMRTFPLCIINDIEIIDLSYNRIRKLTKSDIRKYSNLKMLYLSDNVITSIDDNTFESCDDLQTLDLSLNALSKLPPIIFHLPSLKSLYLGQNLNMNIIDVVEDAKPITAPLIKLDISYIAVEDYQELPDLGIIPYMIIYNISGNKIFNLSPKHFAGICNVQYLDSSNVTLHYYENGCDCWKVNGWLTKRKVKFTQFECSISKTACPNIDINDEDEAFKIHTDCLKELAALNKKSLMLKIGIPIIIVIIVIAVGTVYYYMRRRKRKFKELNDKTIPLNNTADY